MIASNLFGEVHHLADLRLDIILLNTSAMSKGGSKSLPRDEGFMAIPEYAIIDLLSHLKAELCVAVTHHPLSALSEGTARLLRQKLQAHANIHLYGHMHDPVSENIQGALGSVYTSQAGAIYTHRTDYYNGYSIISIARGSLATETLFDLIFPNATASTLA